MTLRGYRLVKLARAGRAFDGEGARRQGGRWNSPGTRLVYAAESLSLAQLEMLVHFERTAMWRGYGVVVAEFPGELQIAIEDQFSLPPDWDVLPPSPATQVLGDRWVRESISVVLSVPTVLTPGERNLLFNPAHPDFGRVKVGAVTEFQFDLRLMKRGGGA